MSPSPCGAPEDPKHTSGLTLDVPDSLLARVAERAADLVVERLDTEAAEPFLDMEGACEFLACKRDRIYTLVSADRIPHHRDGTRLLFRRAELREWVEAGGGKRP